MQRHLPERRLGHFIVQVVGQIRFVETRLQPTLGSQAIFLLPRLPHLQVTNCVNAGPRNRGSAAFSRVAGLELRVSGEPAPAPARSLQELPEAFLPRRIGQPDKTTR